MRPTRPSARPRARGMGLVPYLFVAGIVVWLGIFGAALLWGGGSNDAATGGQPDGGGEAGSVAAGAGEPGKDGGTPDAAEGGSAGAAAPASRQTSADDDYAEVDRADDGGDRGREPSGTRLPRNTSGDGAAPYDPLGTGADAETLSETDLSRARIAAFHFVDAAYDFEGSGPSARLEYLEEVNRAVDAPEFWKSPESPGSDPAELVARKAAEYGVENAALFGSFRVEETSSERVIGTVTFVLDEGGGEKTYEQRLVLGRWAAVWRVLHAKPLVEVS